MITRHRAVLMPVEEIQAAFLEAARPDPRIPIADWVRQNRSLSSAVTALPGPMNIGHTPYMREIYEAMHPRSGVEQIHIVKAAQVSYSELLLSVIAYYGVLCPCPIMFTGATDDDIELFVQQRMADMRLNTPAFEFTIDGAKRARKKSADNEHNIAFRGGILRMVSANSPSRLSSMPVRLLIQDEIDQYQTDIRGQGSPLRLAEERTSTYGRRRKILRGGTPTMHDASAAWAAYEQGDMRRFHVPCPLCANYQALEFERLAWTPGKPETVRYRCAHCRGLIEERLHKTAMLAAGRWVAAGRSQIRSYWIDGLIRPLGSSGWEDIARQWEQAGSDPAELKTFYNLTLGRPYKPDGILEIRSGDLAKRAENWRETIPDGIRVITAGVDVQAQPARFEVEIVGWGDGFESWSLDYRVIDGGIKSPVARQALVDLLGTVYSNGSKRLRIAATCIDSGNQTVDVYDFVKRNQALRVFATKGYSGEYRPIWPIKRNFIKKHRIFLASLGVDQAKNDIYRWAAVAVPGPGYMHTPATRGQEWYDGLLSERREVKLVGGKPVNIWVLPQHRRNEPLDCRVYAYAALRGPCTESGIDVSVYVPVDRPAPIAQTAPEKPAVVQRPAPVAAAAKTQPQRKPAAVNPWGTAKWGKSGRW